MKFLVAISIGPVQDFIAAARRTSDLWAGSQLLVDLAKAVARSLEQQGATLIFPADSQSDGPNKILAQLEAGDASQVAQKVETAKNAARALLHRRFEDALKELSPAQRDLVNHGRAAEQLDAFLELFAAWLPWGEHYAEARSAAGLLLAGRKALRDFPISSQSDAGDPKSSLDPSRAAVIRFKEGVSDQSPLRLKKSEVLDAVSLLKRIEGKTRGVRVLDTTSAALRALEPGAWCPEEDEERDAVVPKVPYYALLIADGDKMGERIKENTTVGADTDLSSKLSDFAGSVKAIVESKENDGFLIYAGGDDVVAIVPLPGAVRCARQLAQEFHQQIGATLSAGVAIVHHKEPLGRALEYARVAEHDAKHEREGQKNSLAVALHVRGGAALTVAAPWKGERDDWMHWLEAFRQEKIARGAVYELAALAREWRDVKLSAELLRGEAWRIWKRKFEGGDVLDLPGYATSSAEALAEFAQKLTIARFLGAKGDA